MAAKRLYYDDPFLLSFRARVVEHRRVEGRPAVLLDRTAFYPTSGGQPHDRGTLNGIAVLDVREADGDILHLLETEVAEVTVHGEVDGQRRFDHMQQHTGQHILSQAFLQEVGATTVSFHLGETYCTIDLDRAGLFPEVLERVEERANAVVFEDLPVRARFVGREEVEALPLRKPPGAYERVRVVEVEGFDWSACGGTHCTRTGQVGPIRITHSERRGEETRVTFLCGWRALRAARQEHNLLVEMAAPLSVGLPDLPAALNRLLESEREARKGWEQAQKELLRYEARERYREGAGVGPARVVWGVLRDRPPEEVRLLAREVAALPGGVALLGLAGEAGRLFFACAEGLPWDMGQLVREAAAVIGGRGGGRPHEAQGGGPNADRLEEALRAALARLRALAGG